METEKKNIEKKYNVLFVDIRGFTKWSSGIEAYEHLDEFIHGFYDIINENFPSAYIKKLGDGVMIVKEIDYNVDKKLIANILKDNIDSIKKIDDMFDDLCRNFELLHGYATKLHLGWGITRGAAKKINGDYVGENINKCKRLCDEARPFGVIIERDDFQDLPKRSSYNFVPQYRKLNGISEDVNVWVTEEIATQFIPREKLREKPEVHVAGTCIKIKDNEIMILIAKRNTEREIYPDLYEGCGGQLRYSESFVEGVKRHFKLEMHIDVEVLEDIHIFYEIIKPNLHKIPGINFLCIFKDGKEWSLNHSEVKWVDDSQFKSIHPRAFIPGLKEEMVKLIDAYKTKYKSH